MATSSLPQQFMSFQEGFTTHTVTLTISSEYAENSIIIGGRNFKLMGSEEAISLLRRHMEYAIASDLVSLENFSVFLSNIKAPLIEKTVDVFKKAIVIKGDSRSFPKKVLTEVSTTKPVISSPRKASLEYFTATVKQTRRDFILAAIGKGEALQGAIRVMTMIKGPLSSYGSRSLVYVRSKEKSVLKIGDKRTYEEEYLVSELFNLMSIKDVVQGFTIKETDPRRLGVEDCRLDYQRGFSLDQLGERESREIRSRLDREDKIKWKLYQSRLRISPEAENYKSHQMLEWEYQNPDEISWRKVSFKQLLNLYLKDELLPEARIKESSSSTSMTFAMHILCQSPLFQALHYSLTFPAPRCYVAPSLRTVIEEDSYKKCEQIRWVFQGKEISFKQIHLAYLKASNKTLFFEEVSLKSSTLTSEWRNILEVALNVSWKFSLPILIDGSRDPDVMERVVAKPFIENMYTVKDFLGNASVLRGIFKRLTLESQFDAIAAGEVQLLDLHPDNVGMAPEINPEYLQFQSWNCSFDVREKSHPTASGSICKFQDLVQMFTYRDLDNYIILPVDPPYQQYACPIKLQIDLRRALNLKWRLVFFDTDVCLHEDNEKEHPRFGGNWSSVPSDSILLSTLVGWRDEPLDETIISRLMNGEKDMRIRKWMSYDDSPILKRISVDARKELNKLIMPILERYNLSIARKYNEQTTVNDLRNQFADDCATESEFYPIWVLLKRELGLVTSLISLESNTAITELAKQLRQSEEMLKKLNPGIEVALKGTQIRIVIDLTVEDPLTVKKRKQLARQLFPRMTVGQQRALIQRQDRRTTYLQVYQKLKSTSKESSEDIIKALTVFLSDAFFLSKKDRTLLIDQLKTITATTPKESDVKVLLEQILTQYQPTYFNIMKAMYPILD